MQRAKAIIVVLGLALALAACGGGSSEEDKVRAAVEAFVQAGNDRDAERACSLLTSDQVAAVEAEAQGSSCEEVLSSVFASSGAGEANAVVDVLEVRVSDDRATVDVRIDPGTGEPPVSRSILLQREDGDWLIADPQF